MTVVPVLAAMLGTLVAATMSGGGGDADAAVEPPVAPTLSVEWIPDTVEVGQTTTLVVTIDNSANTVDGTYSLASSTITGRRFDNTGTVTTDCNVGNQPWSGGELQVTDKELTAGAVCTIQVAMGFDAVGTQQMTVDLTSATNGDVSVGPASITVVDASTPTFSMAFDPAVVRAGEQTVLTVTITNPAYVGATFGFSTSMLDHLVSNSTADDCGGGGHSWSSGVFSTGNRYIEGRTECSFELTVAFDTESEQTVVIDDMTTTLGDPAQQSASIRVAEPVPPVVTIDLDRNRFPAGQAMYAVITIDNTANGLDVPDFDFSTDPIADAMLGYVDSTCGGGGHSMSGGGFSTSTRFVAAGATCTFTLRFVFPAPARHTLTIDDFVSGLGASDPAFAGFTVTTPEPPTVLLDFDPADVRVGQSSRLTITLDNRHNHLDATDLAFATGKLPGVALDDVAQTCLGANSHAIVTGSLQVSSRTVPGESICTISVDYLFSAAGPAEVSIEGATSSLGVSADATVDLDVAVAIPPLVTPLFDAATVEAGELVGLSIEVDNSHNEFDATDLRIEVAEAGDRLVTSAGGSCGGTGTAATGGFVATGVTLAAGATCTIDLMYVFGAAGQQVATAQPVSSNLGGGAAVEAAITVTAPPQCDGRAVTVVLAAGMMPTAGDDVIQGTAGDDVIDALGGDDIVCAGNGDDVVVGGDGDDRLFGEGGRDVLRGNTGEDHVDGGLGDDRVLGGIGNDVLVGGDGDDYLGGFGGDDTISGGPGDEIIFGGFGSDTITGGSGDDVIRGLIGNDTIDGGPGNDVLDGDRGSDAISGGPGADVVNGGNAGDILHGDGGDDSVSGGRADDVLSGGLGNDVCSGNLHFVGDSTDGSCETVFGVP